MIKLSSNSQENRKGYIERRIYCAFVITLEKPERCSQIDIKNTTSNAEEISKQVGLL